MSMVYEHALAMAIDGLFDLLSYLLHLLARRFLRLSEKSMMCMAF